MSVPHIKEPGDVVASAAYGIVELLGARRFLAILGKAVRQQLKERSRANSNKKTRAGIRSQNTPAV